jgi:hypothetical protein
MPDAGSFSTAEAVMAACKLAALHGPLLFFALAAAARLVARDTVERLAAALVIYLSAAAVIPWVAPVSYGWLLAASLVCGAVGVALRRELLASPIRPQPLDAGWVAPALIVGIVMVLRLYSPLIDHDPLTYQLYFPAQWLREGRLFIVPTPFGDPSQAYGPASASVYYLWLMAPLGTDMLAYIGALPFFLLALLAAGGLARELGCRSDRLWAPIIIIVGFDLLYRQAFTALTDVAVAGLFAAALLFFARAGRERSAGSVFIGLLSAGLLIGVKISGLPLLLLLSPVVGWAAWRGGRGLWPGWLAGAAAGAAAGLPWYVRNLALTGNPIFPLRLSLLGWELPGLYGREEMLRWVYHYAGWGKWIEAVTKNFPGPVLAAEVAGIVILIFSFIRGKKVAEREELRPAPGLLIYFILLPLLIDRLIWWGLPYQEYRFWAPIGPILAAVAAAGLARKLWVLAAVFALVTVPSSMLFDPAFLADEAIPIWEPLALYAGVSIAVLVVFVGAWALLKRLAGRQFPLTLLPIAAGALIALATIVMLPGYAERRAKGLQLYEFGGGWSALPCSPAGATVAYTGANVPYPLFGPRLQNRVLYVSPAGDVMPRDHELWAALREKPVFRTPEPALARLRLCPRAWLAALGTAKVDWLFVMRAPKMALVNTEHDAQGWPTERQWAEAAPAIFSLYYQDDFTRLYRINRSSVAAPPWPSGCTDRPADAPAACSQSKQLCDRFFPLFPRIGLAL